MSNSIARKPQENAIDICNAIVGVCLALAPWVLGFTQETGAAWNAWIAGAAIAVIAIGALVAFNEWEEWINLALGVWAFLSPWIVGFSAVTAALYAHVIAGLIVAVLAAGELWFRREQTASRA